MIKFKFNIKITAIILGVIFFILGIITLPDYGINWDTINHLPRGQAYLHYMLTGRKDYKDLPNFFNGWQVPGQWYWQNPSSLGIDTNIPYNNIPKRSLYQLDSQDFQYNMKTDGYGHPPTSDIISALFNTVLFQHLHWINDIDSYHVYGILLAAALVGLIFWWVSKVYGLFAGFIAAISLSLYPLFWSESHFNTEKDVPETVYWSFMFFAIWRGITTKSWKWILTSGVFFGLALGTKFNILFAGPIILVWLSAYLITQYLNSKTKKISVIKKCIRSNIKLILACLIAPIIGFVIFVGTWPYLWTNTLNGLQTVVSFYKDIGTSPSIDSRFIWHFGLNLYPSKWIVYTTPLIILGLSLFGFVVAISRVRRDKDQVSFLFLLWLLIPIVRVTLPGTDIYGGVRQIMEYIPALAILSGLGAYQVKKMLEVILKKFFIKTSFASNLSGLLIILMFIPITLKLIQIHPNENVYFNPLIEGLAGAKSKDIPYWGDSFGAAYRQGVVWLNQHAEKNAKLVYANELIPNIPRIWLRTDLDLQNIYRSGYLREGEYAITLTYQGTNTRSYYDMYLSTFLVPVYEAKVDGVSVLSIWKNDDMHLKRPYTEKALLNIQISKNNNDLILNLGANYPLSRLVATYGSSDCSDLKTGVVSISPNDVNWVNLPGVLPDDWQITALGQQPKGGNFIEPFAGQQAQYIKLSVDSAKTCLMKNLTSAKVYVLN